MTVAEPKVKEEPTPGCYLKARYVLAIMEFFGMTSLQMMRGNISVAIVAMVNTTSPVDVNESALNQSAVCPDRGQGSTDQPASNGMFNWNSADQGLVLGSYYYGYFAAGVPGAWMAQKFGMKYTIGLPMLIASVMTLCSPLVVNFNFEFFIVLRAVMGFLQGAAAPAMMGGWGKWGPPKERSMLISISISGVSLGYFVVVFVGGIISENLGWEFVFYIPGGIATFWSILWLVIIAETPEDHPRISKQEKQYIQESTGFKAGAEKKENSKAKRRRKVPWKNVFTCVPMYAIMTALFANNWTNHTLQSMLPTYMSTVLKYNLSQGGIWSSLPYVFKWITTTVAGIMTDYVRRRKLTSIGVLRKFNTTTGLMVPAVFVVLAGYVGCDSAAAIAFFTIAVAVNGFLTSGCVANSVDIAPDYAGILFGICNTVANITGFLAPQVIGWILLDDNSLTQWQTVFWIAAGLDVTGTVVFLVFGSGNVQSWAKDKSVENDSGHVNTAYNKEDEVTSM